MNNYKVTPEQAIGCALLDNAAAMMQFSANQMGAHFKQKDIADFFMGLKADIEKAKLEMLESWQLRVKLASVADVPVISDKAH